MKTTRSPILAALVAMSLVSCASGPAYVYPRVEGNWMYDYAASLDETGTLPEIPQEWFSELKQEADPLRDRLLVLRNPPEILAVERMGNRLRISGGGRFERTYFLDGTPPSPSSQITFSPQSIVAIHREPEMTLTETWELSPDAETLVITVRAETSKLAKPLDVRRVYRSTRSF